jgi:hypothetical protein
LRCMRWMVRPFCFTCSGPKYSFRLYSREDPCLPILATVLDDSSELHLPLTLQTLHSWENQLLWRNLRVDNGGDWILKSLVAGSLEIVHDGSFMKKVSPKVCSMALWMQCWLTQQSLKCTWVELSNSADNYRGELLGAVCCSLILKAAASAPAPYPKAPLSWHCDNMGVIKHGNRLTARCGLLMNHCPLNVSMCGSKATQKRSINGGGLSRRWRG